MNRYRFENFIDYARTKQGRENMALALIAAGSVAGIVVIGRF